MEQGLKQKRNKKPLYLLLSFLLLFILFIYGLTRPSTLNVAVNELETCYNKKDVEMCWYKYKGDLNKDQQFILSVRNKLNSFNLTDSEILECKSWLPAAPMSLNIVVVPDLSRRITDTINNPRQIQDDIEVLNIIWSSFKETSKFKTDSKDKLIIDVTDIDQAKGQFGEVANELQFDLSSHQGKSNRLYFTDEKDLQFKKSIAKMYSLAKDKPLGADYVFYFRRYLNNHLKKSTLFDTYLNKVIILTDGYLESETRPADTKISGYEKELYPAVNNSNVLQSLQKFNLTIPKVNIDLSDIEILVCEVNERKTGKGYDYEILHAYWKDWFQKMGVKNVDRTFFLQKEQATDLTIKQVHDFIVN